MTQDLQPKLKQFEQFTGQVAQALRSLSESNTQLAAANAKLRNGNMALDAELRQVREKLKRHAQVKNRLERLAQRLEKIA